MNIFIMLLTIYILICFDIAVKNPFFIAYQFPKIAESNFHLMNFRYTFFLFADTYLSSSRQQRQLYRFWMGGRVKI